MKKSKSGSICEGDESGFEDKSPKSGSIESESSDDTYDSASAVSEIDTNIRDLNKGKSFYDYDPEKSISANSTNDKSDPEKQAREDYL